MHTARLTSFLWVPLLLCDLIHPYPLSYFVASGVLAKGGALCSALCATVVVIVALVASVTARYAAPRTRALDVAGGAAAVASIAVILALKQAHTAGASAGLRPETAMILLLGAAPLLATLAASLPCLLLPERAASLVVRALAAAAVASWPVAVAIQRGMAPSDVRLAVIVPGAAAALLAIVRAEALSARRLRLRRVEWLLGFAVPCAVVAAVGLPSIVPARAAGAPASTAKTNVMVIMIDTLRADHTELGGYKRATTPTLVARAGARATYFDQAQAPAASTIPSVKAFLTGLSPSFFGFSNSGPPPGTWTMADAFRAAGYATGGFSANPLVGGEGVSRGFDEFWSAGGDDFVRYSFFLGSLLVPADQPAMVLRYADRLRLHKIDGDTIRRRARSWLERNGGAPFFAYLHLYEPHWPYYDSGYGFAAAAAAKTTQRYSYVDLMNRLPGDPANTALRGTAALEETIARYDEGVRAADDVVAAVLRDLEELGSLDSTLVMITADHGEEFFEHNGYGHGHDVFEEQIHVPMLVLWPAEARFAGTPKTVMEPVSLLDVLPTFARWFDLPQRGEAIHGRSLAGLIMGTSESHPLLSEVHLPTKLYTAYREGPLKARFRHDPTTGPDLEHVLVFDLTRDPGEQAPLPVRDAAVTAFLDRGRALARERWERGARVWQATPPTL